MRVRVLAVSFLLAVTTAAVHANAGKLTQIRLQQEEIRRQTEVATGRYARFEDAELDKLRRAQGQVFELLDGVSDLDQLDATQRTELFNALETVKSVIAANEDDRQMCWREKRLGSHRMETHCATVRERAQLREGARDFKGEPSICGASAANATAASCTGPFGQ